MRFRSVLFLSLLFLCSCSALNTFLGIDDQGNKTDGTPPAKYLTEVLKAFGPIGLVIGGLVTAGGSAYIGNKKGQGRFKAVVAGIQKVKKEMPVEEKEILVSKLKEHIPNKYHDAIKHVKDRL